MEVMIKEGNADVNRQRSDGITPMLIAAEKNVSPGLMKVMIKAGGDVARLRLDGVSTLIIAGKCYNSYVLSRANVSSQLTRLHQWNLYRYCCDTEHPFRCVFIIALLSNGH